MSSDRIKRDIEKRLVRKMFFALKASFYAGVLSLQHSSKIVHRFGTRLPVRCFLEKVVLS